METIIKRKMFLAGVIVGIIFGIIPLLSKNPFEIILLGVLTSTLIVFLFVFSSEKKDYLIMGSPVPLIVVIETVFFLPEKEGMEKIYLYGKFFIVSLIIFLALVYIIKSRLKKIP